MLPHIEDHGLSLTAGYNQEYNYYHDSYIQALDVLSADTDVLNAATTPSKITGTSTDSAVRSFFGRVNYDYRGVISSRPISGPTVPRVRQGQPLGLFPLVFGGLAHLRGAFSERCRGRLARQPQGPRLVGTAG